jgi:hypothetical protein
MTTPNEQLVASLKVIEKKLARAKFLHEPWVTLSLSDVELLFDAAEEFKRDLILPTDSESSLES